MGTIQYPNSLERASSNLATLGTYLAIILTLGSLFAAVLGTMYAMNYFQDTKNSLSQNAREEALNIAQEHNKYLRAVLHMTQGIMYAHTAWDRNDNYKSTDMVYLWRDALDATRLALKKFTELKEKKGIFTPKIDEDTIRCVNNLIFYSALAEDRSQETSIVKYAQHLRANTDFDKEPHRANTYILALIVFRQSFALTLRKNEDDIALERDIEISLQEKRALSPFDRKELDWLKTKF